MRSHAHMLLVVALSMLGGCQERPAHRPKSHDPDVVRQSKRNTCGPAALAMLLTSLGHHATERELEQQMTPGPDGVTLSSLVATSGARGAPLEAWRLSVDTLRSIRPPAILWVDGDHFVVFDSLTLEGAHLRDPSAGRIVLTRERLKKRWDGTAALVAWPP